ncbi:MAG: prolipoprotein diacylglyceryl transferase [Steroidobacteraceae bacterium]
MLTYPAIDPVAFAIGPVKIHWYGLMYVVGFVAGWWLARRRAAVPGSTWKPADVDDLIFFAAIGVIAGGRLGWILVYGFGSLVEDPLSIIRVWEGGMSFHGGLIGVMIAVALFAHRRGRHIADVFDFTAPLPAVGLFAGRIGNFINGELWGKPTDLPWGMLVDGEARHPSQLYEAGLEGILLFALMWWYTAKPRPRLAPAGLFLILYALFRMLVEFVRVPDAHIGYLAFGWVTMGQLLSLPVLLAGLGMLTWALLRRQRSGNIA